MFRFINFTFIAILCCSSLFGQMEAIKVEVVGKGPDIIFLPGFACPGDVWDDLVSELSKTNTCHIVSYAGFNGIEAIEDRWLASIKSSLEKYILDKKIRPSLIGHSLGGSIGFWLCIEKNVDIERIISVDGLASVGALMIPNFSSDMISYDSPQNQQMLNMPNESFKEMTNQMSKSMVLDTSYHELISKWMMNSDRKTYVNGYTDLLKLDLRADLNKINVPVSIIAAVYPFGKEMVAETYKSQFQQLDKYDIFFAEKSAHFIMLDEPKWLEEIIKSIVGE